MTAGPGNRRSGLQGVFQRGVRGGAHRVTAGGFGLLQAYIPHFWSELLNVARCGFVSATIAAWFSATVKHCGERQHEYMVQSVSD